MQLRHRTVKNDAKANPLYRKHSRKSWLVAGVLLAGAAGMIGWGAVELKKAPSLKDATRTVIVCPSKDSPPESCKPHICKDTGGKRLAFLQLKGDEVCRPASREELGIMEAGWKQEKKAIWLAVAAVAILLIPLLGVRLVRGVRALVKGPSKQESEKTGA